MALEMTNEILQLNPRHELALGNKLYYEKALARKALEKSVVGFVESSIQKRKSPDPFEPYEALCRNEVHPEPAIMAKLHCRYVTNNSPFLKIAPLKLEEAYHRPDIVIYHDVIYNKEIEVIQQLAKPRFERSAVQDDTGNDTDDGTATVAYRISKSAWLEDEDHKYVADIALRLEDMTGLITSTAEPLQVANYGIGGHYEPHIDFAGDDEPHAFGDLGTGNRIATVLFYVSGSFENSDFFVEFD